MSLSDFGPAYREPAARLDCELCEIGNWQTNAACAFGTGTLAGSEVLPRFSTGTPPAIP